MRLGTSLTVLYNVISLGTRILVSRADTNEYDRALNNVFIFFIRLLLKYVQF